MIFKRLISLAFLISTVYSIYKILNDYERESKVTHRHLSSALIEILILRGALQLLAQRIMINNQLLKLYV